MARTRAALLEALLSLLEEKALDQITIKELTSRAGVGYATYFRRYSGKEELLHDLAAQEIQRLLALSMPLLYAVDSPASTQALCTYVWEHRKLWRAFLTGGAASMLKEEYLRQALQVAREGYDSEAPLPFDLAVRFSVTAILETLSWWLVQEEPPTAREMAGTIDRLAVAPVLSPGG